MAALGIALRHPMNRGHALATLLKWTVHNVERRLRPTSTKTVPVDGTLITGPISHPTICLARYVRSGWFDYEAMLAAAVFCPSMSAYVDVGASIGSHSSQASRYLPPSASIVAFEPNPSEAKWLKRNLSALSRPSTVIEEALADKPGTALFQFEGPTTSHLGTSGRPIDVNTLDIVMHRLSIRRAFLKIDVEGWEPAVILGGLEWLSEYPHSILMEANGLNQRCPIPWSTAVDALRRLGYSFWWPDWRSQTLLQFSDPPPISPYDNYLVLRPSDATLLERALRHMSDRGA